MIRHTRRTIAALTATAAITAGCAACALLPRPAHQARPPASPTRPAAAPAVGLATLLPLSPAQLQAAAALAARFAAAYGTHHPGEPPGAWLARLAPMATRQLAGALNRAGTTGGLQRPGVAGTGKAVAEQIRVLTPASVIVTVQVRQTAATSYPARLYAFAVTVTRHSGGWVVYDIEPATAGDTGGTADGPARQ